MKYTNEVRLVDTYWEDFILESSIFEIHINSKFAGVFSIHNECSRLTSFHVEDEFWRLAHTIFMSVIEKFKPETAYVVTSDELLLSLLCDFVADDKNNAKLELQAYFFDDVQDVPIDKQHEHLQLYPATQEHLPLLKELDFFDRLSLDDPTDVIYVLFDDDEFLGAGHIQTMLFERKWGAVGMVTSPNHRQKGIGKAIITMEKQICKAQGLIPIAGCWYFNHASKNTLEACGFASKTRLIKVTLRENECE